MFVCAFECAHTCVHVRKPEADIRYLSLTPSRWELSLGRLSIQCSILQASHSAWISQMGPYHQTHSPQERSCIFILPSSGCWELNPELRVCEG